MTIPNKNIILDVIRTGSFPKLINLNLDLSHITNENLIKILKGNDTAKYNYSLAEKIANQLMIEKNKLKKNITRLIALELNYYENKLQRDKIYSQISSLASNLLAFPENKRIIKFLVKFTRTSKVLQNTLQSEKNFEILKVYHSINMEVK